VDNTMLIRPGQQLPDGAWLREIHPKNVVLEHEGNLESVAIYRQGESAGSAEVYPLPQQAPPVPQQAPPLPQQATPLSQQAPPPSQQAPPLPQQARWEEPEETAVEHTEPSQGEATDTPSSLPGPAEGRQSETPANQVRSSDVLPDDTPTDDASPQQARPDAPLPASPDPADELSDSRRQRAESRKIQSTDS